jgi:outer membrane protein TolC
MKHLLFSSLLFFSISVHAEGPYSIADCQALTLQHSERLSIAEIQTLIAEDRTSQIEGILNPKMKVEGTYRARGNHPGAIHNNPLHALPLPTPPPGQELPEIPDKVKTIAGRKKVATTRTSLIVPIWDFGRVPNAVMAQRSNVEASVHERDRIEQDLLLAVAESYYGALEAKKLEGVVLESIRVLQQQLAISTDMYEVGLATKNDILVVEVQLAEREQELIQARYNMQKALDILSRLMETSVTSVEQLSDVNTTVSWGESCDKIIAEADVHHPVLKKLLSQNQAAQFDYESVKSENYPEISAFADYNTSSDPFLLHKQWVTGGLTIQIPIFEGGITTAKMAERRKRITSLDLAYKEALFDIHLQIKNAFLEVDSSFSKIPVAQKSIHRAEESLKISRDQFEEGMLSIDDVMNDEQRLAQARSNYYQALYNFYMAKVDLEYVAGLLQQQKDTSYAS